MILVLNFNDVYFDLVVKLTPIQQLEHYIQRVVRLKNFFKFHEMRVLELPHNLDFLDQTLLAVLLTVGCLL